MKIKTIQTVLILSVVLNIAFIAGVGIHTFSGEEAVSCAHSNGGYVFEKLNLDEAQRKKIMELAEAFHLRLDEISGGVEDANKKLIMEIVSSENAGENTDGLIEDISGKQKKIQELIVNHLYEIKAEMDNSQQEQFFKLLEDAFASKRGVY